MPTPKDPFVMFVSSVEGHLVARYGAGPHALIGARHGDDGPEWQPEQVFPLTELEVAQYGREYQRAIKDGALKVCKREDFDAYVKAENAAAEKTKKDQEAAAKKAAADAQKQDAQKQDAQKQDGPAKAADVAQEGK